MSLRELDDRLVPRFARALRALRDRAAPARAATRLRRLDDRYARTGPLAVLRRTPAFGVLASAAVLVAGAGLAVARTTPTDPARPAVAAPDLSLGVPAGVDADEHLLAARQRLVALSDRAPDDRTTALVSLTQELTPLRTGQLLAESDLVVRRSYVRAPVEGDPEVLTVEAPGDVPGDVRAGLEAVFAATAARRAEEQRELLELAEAAPAGAAPAPLQDRYEAYARTRGLEAAAYGAVSDCACVIALVVEGPVRQVAELLALPVVRGVEAAGPAARLDELRIDPLPPASTGVRVPAARPSR